MNIKQVGRMSKRMKAKPFTLCVGVRLHIKRAAMQSESVGQIKISHIRILNRQLRCGL